MNHLDDHQRRAAFLMVKGRHGERMNRRRACCFRASPVKSVYTKICPSLQLLDEERTNMAAVRPNYYAEEPEEDVNDVNLDIAIGNYGQNIYDTGEQILALEAKLALT